MTTTRWTLPFYLQNKLIKFEYKWNKTLAHLRQEPGPWTWSITQSTRGDRRGEGIFLWQPTQTSKAGAVRTGSGSSASSRGPGELADGFRTPSEPGNRFASPFALSSFPRFFVTGLTPVLVGSVCLNDHIPSLCVWARALVS